MTEAEWLASRSPWPMLEYLRQTGNTSERRLQLFGVACCRRIAHRIPDVLGRRALGVAERFADGEASKREVDLIADAFWPCGSYKRDYGHPATRASYYALCPGLIDRAATWALYACRRRDRSDECAVQTSLLRCIFGNPFRPVLAVPASALVRKLAQAIYEERAFDRLPLLADALEDDGCTNADVLSHCREPGEHARGCWVVDLLRR
jgi:hypothetical protein